MMTEEKYNQYISDFNAACAGDGNAFGGFYEKSFMPQIKSTGMFRILLKFFSTAFSNS